MQTTGKVHDDGVTPLLNDTEGFDELVPEGKENKWNMILPLIVLIGGTFAGLFITGHGKLAEGDGAATSILHAVTITLIVMCIMYTKQGIMSAKEFGDSVMKGVSSMMGLVILLVLSFAIGQVIKGMGTGQFLASLLGDSISGAFCPAMVFIMGAVMAFCTGTSWGTFSIMMPIAIPMAVAMNANILLTIGAVVSSGIFGDHCSPLSDTTILSSMSVGTDLFSHVKTQAPGNAILTAACATVLYIVFGFAL